MAPKKSFFLAADTPNVSPKLSPATLMPSVSFPLSSRSLPGPGAPGMPRPIRRPKKILYLGIIFFLLYWVSIRHGLGMERLPPLPLGFALSNGQRIRPRTMSWLRNGLASLLPLAAGSHPEHPFYELMEKAEDHWNTLLKSQSRTLSQAKHEYRRRYSIDPPAGFDRWFMWARENGIELIDEYDIMMRDVLAHHALDPATFIMRSHDLENAPFTYTLDISSERVEITGERSRETRPGNLAAMIDGFRQSLPSGFHLRITGSDHDTSSVVLGKDQRQRALQLVRKGQHFAADELRHLEDPGRTPAFGWFKACPLDSPANIRPGAENVADGDAPKSFIHDHLATMDFCEFPELKRLHGALCMDWEDRSPSILKPWLVHSKLPGDASFLLAPIDGFANLTYDDVAHLGAWEEKLDSRVQWRGSSTGGYNKQRNWRESHRMRLHLLFNGRKGGDPNWAATTHKVMVPDGVGGYETITQTAAQLASAYADVKLAGQPVQCPNAEICTEIDNEIEFGDLLWPADTWMFRYALDVDGNGWSSRFHRLISSGSPVLKMTMFADWNMDRLIPWYHYIPIRPDYSDIYDVLAFFIGPINVDGSVDLSKGHDYLGKKIGQAGQEFSLKQWRWVDMQAYTYRLLLELNRLHSLDRKAASLRS